ncbi:MAG: hypothetical protein CVV37_03460 [Nitrospira bacterium HGW-Nitrospira-1]|nr:MAG: hypothetical protein CVV37_03460 [Nitrospira bacterium HGW-Nitrospira-1]
MKHEPALVVMDIQEGFFGEKAKLPIHNEDKNSFLDDISELVGTWTKNGRDVIYVRTIYGKWSPLNFFTKSAVKAGTEGASLISSIYRKGFPVFDKNTPNIFTNPDFEKYLQETHHKEIVICGVFIEYCVSRAAFTARNKGYKVSVIKDLVGYRNKDRFVAILKKMEKAGITLNGKDKYKNL